MLGHQVNLKVPFLLAAMIAEVAFELWFHAALELKVLSETGLLRIGAIALVTHPSSCLLIVDVVLCAVGSPPPKRRSWGGYDLLDFNGLLRTPFQGNLGKNVGATIFCIFNCVALNDFSELGRR